MPGIGDTELFVALNRDSIMVQMKVVAHKM